MEIEILDAEAELDDAEAVFEQFSEGGQGGYVIDDNRKDRPRRKPRLFGPWAEDAAYFKRGLDNSGDKLLKAIRLMRGGWGARTFRRDRLAGPVCEEVARALRMAVELFTGEKMTCPCGRDARHKGQCSFRRSMSPAFQKIHGEYQATRPNRQYMRWLTQFEKRESVRQNRRIERSIQSYQRWSARRAFTRPVPDENAIFLSLHQRVKAELEYEKEIMVLNFKNALPQLGEGPVRQIEVWHRCERPKPSFGVMKRWLRELAVAGVVTKDPANASHKAGLLRSAAV